MRRLRNLVTRGRGVLLALLVVELFYMVGGPSFAQALEMERQRRRHEQAVRTRVLGLPAEASRNAAGSPSLFGELERAWTTWWNRPVPSATPAPPAGPASKVVGRSETSARPAEPRPRRAEVLDPERRAWLESAFEDDANRAAPDTIPLHRSGRFDPGPEAPLPLRRVAGKASVEPVGRRGLGGQALTSAVAPASAPREAPDLAVAPELIALAESLGRSPGRIFRFVHDKIGFEPRWGAAKPPLGTYREGSGTPWEQAWLLQHLLAAAGVDARLEWGEVEIPPDLLTQVTGVADPVRAGDLLTTAGVPVTLLVDGAVVVAARLSHVWVKAHLDYIPNRGATPGVADTWVRLDPSLTRFETDGGVRLDEAVPFELGAYLTSGALEAPGAVYEGELQAHLEAHATAAATPDDARPPHTVVAEGFPFVPGTLRAKILSVAGEAAELPAGFRQTVEIQVRRPDGTPLLVWSGPWAAAYGQRLELAWPGATADDEASLDLNGGVFSTPPFEVDLRPTVRLEGIDLAAGDAIGAAEDVEVLVTLLPPAGVSGAASSPIVALFDLYAGEPSVLTADFGRIPQEHVDRLTAGRDAAASPDEQAAWGLAMAGSLYLRTLAEDVERLAELRYRRLVPLGNVVLAVQRGAVSVAADGTPLTFAPAPPSLDLGAMVVGLFPADGVLGPLQTAVGTLELLVAQASAREGLFLTSALGGEHLTAVSFLTRAVREGQNLTRVDAANLEPALAAAVLSDTAEASVRVGVGRGLVAWISETQLSFDSSFGAWDTTGYVLEDPATGAGGTFVTFERPVPELAAELAIHAPVDLSEVTEPVNVVASVEGDDVAEWALAFRAAEGGPVTELASGVGAFPPTVVAVFDPTLLLNGLYDLVLTARDGAGQSGSRKISVVVDGQQKIGNFTLSFVDLSIPLSGLALEVVRTYDSRDKQVGDFGVGWRLDLRQGSYTNNRRPGDGWQLAGGFLPCQGAFETKSHLTTIRLSDVEIYRFAPVLSQLGLLGGGCVGQASYRFVDGPVPGATLEILGNTQVAYTNGSDRLIDFDSLEIYEPRAVRLTTPDGRIFDLDLEAGVTRAADLNGNELTLTPGGVTHSDGKGLVFTRDDEGRLTGITDPLGYELAYGYDAAGDLVSFTDRLGKTVRFTYDGDHGLLDIEDPRGITPIRNDYDADGRLIRHTDAFGQTIELTHDLAADTEVITDRLGHSRVLQYDARGNIVLEVDALGGETVRTFDADDRLLTVRNALGHITTHEYDTAGNQITTIDPLGHVTRRTFDERRRLLTLTDPLGGVITNTYDAAGNLLTTTDAVGEVTRYTYDDRGNLETETDPLGGVRRYETDGDGHLIREVDRTGHATIHTYDANGNRLTTVSTRTLADGAAETLTTRFVYDAAGRVTSTVDPAGATTSTVYDELGHVLRSIDPLGREIEYVYGQMGRLLETVYPDDLRDTQTYDAEGRVLTRTDRAGRVTRFAYDALGRLVTTTLPGGATLSQTYDAAGQLLTRVDERGFTTTYAYDALGRRLRTADALDQVMASAYDANGNRVSATDPKGRVTRFFHDAANRLVRTVYADDTEETTTYDALSRRVAETDAAGHITRFGYDLEGRLTSVTDALSQVTRYAYDEVGNRVAQTDANGHVTTFAYDAVGREIRRTLPAVGGHPGATETKSYDPVGNLTAHVNFNGQSRSFEYDDLDRLTARRLPGGESYVFTYTPTGRRSTAVDIRGVTSYGYDERDRLTTMTYPDGRSLAYGYDIAGNRTSVAVTLGAVTRTTASTFDALGRLDTVTDPSGRVYDHDYDLNGNRASLAYPNGVTTTYAYDLRDRLTDLTTAQADGEVVQSYGYDLGPAGNRLSVTEDDGTVRAYGYDALFRLVRERVTVAGAPVFQDDFVYDPVGNRLERTTVDTDGTVTVPSTYDERDRLLTQGGSSLTWDAAGRILSRSGADGATYTWDVEERLNRVEAADGTVVMHVYDADGVRVRTTTTPAGGPPQVTDYLVDTSGALAHVVAEADAAGDLTAYYIRGNDLLAVERPSGARFYHADGLGSIRVLTDEAGVVTDRYAFKAFGELLEHQGSDPNAYLFAGEALDPNSGFYYLRARWMSPGAGQFVSVDPFIGAVFEPQSLHKYNYVEGDPVNMVDPTGLTAMTLPNLALALDALALAVLTVVAISAVGVLAIDLIRDPPRRMNHYTRWEFLHFIMTPGPTGGINNPKGPNFLTPDYYFSGTRVKSRLALPRKPEVGINLVVYMGRDKLRPITIVRGAFNELGGGRETSTNARIPFYSRSPILYPLIP
jgi:RHS repeat-associated protein